jgi:hypothetical protein
MASGFHVDVGRIKPEKDEYKTESGDVVPDTDFWKGNDKAVDIQKFKRFKIDLKITKDGAVGTCALTVSLRGNIVMVASPKGVGVTPKEVFNALHKLARRFDYALEARAYVHDPAMPVPTGTAMLPVPIADQSARQMHLSVTGNPYWLVDLLHHARDAGGFNEDGRIPA